MVLGFCLCLGQRVVVAVACAVHGRFDARLGQAFAVAHGDLLAAAVIVMHELAFARRPLRWVLVLGVKDHTHRALDHLVGILRGLPHLGSILNRRSLLEIRGDSLSQSASPMPSCDDKCAWISVHTQLSLSDRWRTACQS